VADAPDEMAGANGGAARYAICVQEHLAPTWAEWFDGFAFAYCEGGETMLTGPVADQAALHGLLAKVRDLNLTLIAVTREDAAHSPRGQDDITGEEGAS
jgi:hypothetical protein